MNEFEIETVSEQAAAIRRSSTRAAVAVGASSRLNGLTHAAVGCTFGATVALVGFVGPQRPRPFVAALIAVIALVTLAVTSWSRTRRRGARAGWRRVAARSQMISAILWAVATTVANSSVVTVPMAAWLGWAVLTAAPMVAVGVREALPAHADGALSAGAEPLGPRTTARMPLVSVRELISERERAAVRLLFTGAGFGVFTVFIGAFRSHMHPVSAFLLLTTAIEVGTAVLPRRSRQPFLLVRVVTLVAYVVAGLLSAFNALPASPGLWAGVGIVIAAPAVVVSCRALPAPRQ